ncbi:hypothetical protein Tco_0038654 [Tanacetum coccineum]
MVMTLFIPSANVEGEEPDEEEINKEHEANELYMDVNVNLEGIDTKITDAPCTIIQTTQVIEDTHVIITPVNPEGQQQSSSVSSGFVSNMLNPSPDTGTDSIFNLNTESTLLVDVPVTTIAEPSLLFATILLPPPTPLITHLQQTPVPIPATQTNQFAAIVSLIPGIVDAYLANKMHEAVKTVVQLQSDRLIYEAQAENADFINKLDDNIKKIIKDQVKEQVKAQVSKILPKIKKTVNEQLEAEVLTCSSNESKTSHAVAANLSELELKKILIDKMERSKSHHKSAGESAQAEEPMHTAKDLEEPAHQEFKTGVIEDQPDEETSQLPDWFQKLAKPPTPDHQRESFNELMDTPLDFLAFVMNQLKVDTLTPELLAGPTFELIKGSCKSLVELEYLFEEVYKETIYQLDWNNPEDVYSKCRIIAVTKLQIVEWHNYKHLDWITIRRDDDKLYKFKEGDFNRLRIQDIEDMLLLLVQGKLTNLTFEERLAFNVSL